jgi:D-glycero-D-manno-heptose 1,7-bisphosphate phosphatase
MSTAALRPAAFLDRDGVLNQDLGYVHRVADFHWVPGAVQALQRLQAAGYALVVVTNQSGVARGMYTLADVDTLHAHMQRELAAAGVVLTGIYRCPHLPDAPLPAYRLNCDCRKPGPGLLLQALREHALDASLSVMVGDRASDIQAGQAAGVARCLQVGPGQAAADLAAAVDLMLGPTR